MSKDVFETLADDSLQTGDGEVVTSNQSTYNFDEVESLTDEPAPKEKEESKDKEEKEPVKTAADSNKTLDDAAKAKKQEKEHVSEDEGIEEQVEDSDREATEEPKKEESNVKKIAAKAGDSELEIPSDALIPHKVDGEEVEVPLQELLNNYSGKQAWDKRFSELDKERKEYQKERDLVERYVNDFSELAQGEDKLKAMEYLAEFAGINPIDFRRQLREQVLEKYGNYQEMSEIERKALDQEEELSYHKRLRESESQKAEEQKAAQELQNRLEGIQETHNISEDELSAAYDELVRDYDGEVTPDVLEKYVANRNAWFSAKDAVSNVSPDLLNQDGFVDDVADMILSNPELGAEDIQDIISQVAGLDKQKRKQQKISDKVRQSQSKPPKKEQEKEEFLTFDDL